MWALPGPRKELILTCARQRMVRRGNHGSSRPSRFVEEIPPLYLKQDRVASVFAPGGRLHRTKPDGDAAAAAARTERPGRGCVRKSVWKPDEQRNRV